MIASPSMGSPTDDPLIIYPSPCATDVRASLLIVLRSWWGDRCYFTLGVLPRRVCGVRAYRTVLASSSIGAPDSTAAGKTSPSSLPFITRFGIGEKSLGILAGSSTHGTVDLRRSLIDLRRIIWLIVSGCLRLLRSGDGGFS